MVVAGGGGFVGLFDAVAVVAGAFDRAGAGAFPALRDQVHGDVSEVFGELVSPVMRGECPPFRWRYGGPVAACG